MFNWKDYQTFFNNESEHAFIYLSNEYAKISAGRANPQILNGVMVEAYGEPTKLTNIANVSTPDPRTIVIKPYDRSLLKEIASGLNAAKLNLNFQVDADVIKITFSAPTEDMRKTLVKKAKEILEQGKQLIRKARQATQDLFKKDETVTDDDKKSFTKQLDAETKVLNNKLEQVFENKSKEIMTI